MNQFLSIFTESKNSIKINTLDIPLWILLTRDFIPHLWNLIWNLDDSLLKTLEENYGEIMRMKGNERKSHRKSISFLWTKRILKMQG